MKLVCQLIEMISPRAVLTIGRDAEAALQDLGIAAHCVRHPSYGGQNEFIEGVKQHYGLTQASTDMENLPLFAC
jgi:hypothetical protein